MIKAALPPGAAFAQPIERSFNVKVTGTLRQGAAARCRISKGALQPLAATCLNRPTR